MAFSAVAVLRGPGELAAMVLDVARLTFTSRFQFREFIEQAWCITSVTLMPTILVSIPFGAVISLQVGNLTGQLGVQSFAGRRQPTSTSRSSKPPASASWPPSSAATRASTWAAAPAASAARSTTVTDGYLPVTERRSPSETSFVEFFPAECRSGAPVNMRGMKYAPPARAIDVLTGATG